LVTAQKFKSSWVELGALLVKVRHEGLWEEWGFAGFEEYCSKELRLKRQRETRVAGDRHGRDVVHLNGDFQRHGILR
jgi:hypothetical protein